MWRRENWWPTSQEVVQFPQDTSPNHLRGRSKGEWIEKGQLCRKNLSQASYPQDVSCKMAHPYRLSIRQKQSPRILWGWYCTWSIEKGPQRLSVREQSKGCGSGSPTWRQSTMGRCSWIVKRVKVWGWAWRGKEKAWSVGWEKQECWNWHIRPLPLSLERS